MAFQSFVPEVFSCRSRRASQEEAFLAPLRFLAAAELPPARFSKVVRSLTARL